MNTHHVYKSVDQLIKAADYEMRTFLNNLVNYKTEILNQNQDLFTTTHREYFRSILVTYDVAKVFKLLNKMFATSNYPNMIFFKELIIKKLTVDMGLKVYNNLPLSLQLSSKICEALIVSRRLYYGGAGEFWEKMKSIFEMAGLLVPSGVYAAMIRNFLYTYEFQDKTSFIINKEEKEYSLPYIIEYLIAETINHHKKQCEDFYKNHIDYLCMRNNKLIKRKKELKTHREATIDKMLIADFNDDIAEIERIIKNSYESIQSIYEEAINNGYIDSIRITASLIQAQAQAGKIEAARNTHKIFFDKFTSSQFANSENILNTYQWKLFCIHLHKSMVRAEYENGNIEEVHELHRNSPKPLSDNYYESLISFAISYKDYEFAMSVFSEINYVNIRSCSKIFHLLMKDYIENKNDSSFQKAKKLFESSIKFDDSLLEIIPVKNKNIITKEYYLDTHNNSTSDGKIFFYLIFLTENLSNEYRKNINKNKNLLNFSINKPQYFLKITINHGKGVHTRQNHLINGLHPSQYAVQEAIKEIGYKCELAVLSENPGKTVLTVHLHVKLNKNKINYSEKPNPWNLANVGKSSSAERETENKPAITLNNYDIHTLLASAKAASKVTKKIDTTSLATPHKLGWKNVPQSPILPLNTIMKEEESSRLKLEKNSLIAANTFFLPRLNPSASEFIPEPQNPYENYDENNNNWNNLNKF